MFKEFVRLMSELIKLWRNGQLHVEEDAVKCGTMVREKKSIVVREFHFRLVGTLNTDRHKPETSLTRRLTIV